MEEKLKLYYEDIDSIFEQYKQELGYNNFTVTSKSKFDPIIEQVTEASRKYIELLFQDTEEAINGLCNIDYRTKMLFIGFRVADESYKHSIYNMSPEAEIDSMLPYGFSDKQWTPIISK